MPLTKVRVALVASLLASPALAAVPDASRYQLAASEPGNYLSAIIASADRDSAAAAVYFREALRADPRNIDLIERAFAATLVSGDAKDAYGLADRLAARDPSNSLARLALSVRAFSNGNYAGARAQLAAGDAGKARDVTSLLLTGWAWAGAGDLRHALESVDRINDPNVQVFRDYHAALIADALGDPAEALRRFKLAYARDSQTLRLVDAYARFLARHKDVAGAKKVYADFSARTPDHPVVKAALAEINSGRPVAPIVRNPKEGAAEALYGLGSAGTRQGDELASLIYLRLALALRPDHEFAEISVANLLSDMKRGTEAIAAYLAVPKTSPLAESSMIQAAIEYDALNQTDKGLALLKQVVAEHPEDPEAWSALGTLQRSAKDFAAAAQSYDKAISKLPAPDKAHWVLFYFRGIAYERTHQWPKAEADFKEALKLYPDQPLVLNYLGYSWVDQGVNLEEALKMLRRAVDLKPTDGYIVDSLGWANFKLGHYEEATRELERAVELKPVDPVVNDHLGDAYWRVGRKIEAHFQWNHARDFGPEPDDLKKILGKIKDGLPGARLPAPPPRPRRARSRRRPAAEGMRLFRAPAKVNLTLHILGRRADGYHELDSLVAFAGVGDRLAFVPGEPLGLEVAGPTAQAAGPEGDNLVLKAARALAERAPGLRLGRFVLDKQLPVAAGLGGGSSDAAAALRALAAHNGLALADDPRSREAARATGADVPVCLDPRARRMGGIGELLSAPLGLPPLPAVLVNPRAASPTPAVFAGMGLARGQSSGAGGLRRAARRRRDRRARPRAATTCRPAPNG